MNILLGNINYYPHIGGIENSFRSISEIYKREGHRIAIICSNKPPNGEKKLKDFEIINEIEVYRYDGFESNLRILKILSSIMHVIQSYKLAKKLDQEFNFDFALVRNMKVGLGVKLALNKKKVIYVLSALTKLLDYKEIQEFKGSFIKRLFLWLFHNKLILGQDILIEKILLKIATLNVVFSNNMLDQVNNFIEKGNNNLLLIKPGVDSDRFNAINEYQKRDSKKLFDFLILGRLIKVKGVDMAIKSIAKISNDNIRLTVVGDGPELNSLVKLTKELNLEGKVKFIPKTSKPEKYYSNCDAFLMTSYYESFGQTILEAMSSGLPIIGFEPDGKIIKTSTSEIVENEVNGFLCAYTIEDLAISMNSLLEMSRKELKRISERNREKVIQNYSWENFTNSIIDVVSEKK